MARSEVHKKKLRKNLAILGLIFLWVFVIWMVTMIRIARADEGNFGPIWRGRNYTGIGAPSHPVDTRGAMYNARTDHREKSAETKQQWDETFRENADRHLEELQTLDEQRDTHFEKVIETKDSWDETYRNNQEAQMEARESLDQARAAQQEKTENAPRGWWDNWQAHEQEKQAADEDIR